MSEWVRTSEHGLDYIESLGGIDWADAPLPGWWHRCRVQTRGCIGGDFVARCACGRTADSAGWLGSKNETRRARRRDRQLARLPDVSVRCLTCGCEYTAKQGTPIAASRQCDGCWSRDFLAMRALQRGGQG